MFVGLQRAHINARCGNNEEEWAELLEEFSRYGKDDRLTSPLYGMRRAASRWEDDYTRRVVSDGYRRGRAE